MEDYSMEDNKKALNDCAELLRRHLNAQRYMSYLSKEEVIDEFDSEPIFEMEDKNEKARALTDTLTRRKEGFKWLMRAIFRKKEQRELAIECLKMTGHEEEVIRAFERFATRRRDDRPITVGIRTELRRSGYTNQSAVTLHDFLPENSRIRLECCQQCQEKEQIIKDLENALSTERKTLKEQLEEERKTKETIEECYNSKANEVHELMNKLRALKKAAQSNTEDRNQSLSEITSQAVRLLDKIEYNLMSNRTNPSYSNACAVAQPATTIPELVNTATRVLMNCDLWNQDLNEHIKALQVELVKYKNIVAKLRTNIENQENLKRDFCVQRSALTKQNQRAEELEKDLAEEREKIVHWKEESEKRSCQLNKATKEAEDIRRRYDELQRKCHPVEPAEPVLDRFHKVAYLDNKNPHGVLHAFGTNFGQSSRWSNPSVHGHRPRIAINTSKQQRGEGARDLLDSKTVHIEPHSHGKQAWLTINLGQGYYLFPTHYSLTSGLDGAPSSWILQGKCNANDTDNDWITLRTHRDEGKKIQKGKKRVTWKLEGDEVRKPMKVFMLKTTSEAESSLVIAGLEFYGIVLTFKHSM